MYGKGSVFSNGSVLFTSYNYHLASHEHRFGKHAKGGEVAICNGVGPSGLLGDLIPDRMLGADFSECGNIHDWDFTFGETDIEMHYANENFRHNMIEVCNTKHQLESNAAMRGTVLTRWYRKMRALDRHYKRLEYVDTCYKAVEKFGQKFFHVSGPIDFKWEDIGREKA